MDIEEIVFGVGVLMLLEAYRRFQNARCERI